MLADICISPTTSYSHFSPAEEPSCSFLHRKGLPTPTWPLICQDTQTLTEEDKLLIICAGANSGKGLFTKQENTQQEDLSLARGMGHVLRSGTHGKGCAGLVVTWKGTGCHQSSPMPKSDLNSTAAARTGSKSSGKSLRFSLTSQENQWY